MKKRVKIGLIVVVLVIAGALLYAYLGKNEKEASPEQTGLMKKVGAYLNKGKKGTAQAGKASPFANMAIPVEAVEARRGSIEINIAATGDVAARNQVTVYSKAEGRIVDLLVDRGDRVKQGQLLAVVEDEEPRARVAEAKAAMEIAKARRAQMEAGLRPQELEQARDEVQKAEAEFKNAGLNVERARELLNKGFIPPQQLDEVNLRHTSAKSFLNSAREKLKMAEEGYRVEDRQAALAQLHQAEANLQTAEIRLADTRVSSPIEGIIGQRMVDKGAFVRGSTAIFNIVDMDTVKVLINLTERDIPSIKRGHQAQISVDAYPGQAFTGAVDKISPVVDRESRTGEVELLVQNREQKLKPGMFARVKMIVARRDNSILIPAHALISRDGKSYLFIHENGKAVKRNVAVGISDGAKAEVLENLREGEEVIAAGLEKLKDNSPVNVMNKGNAK